MSLIDPNLFKGESETGGGAPFASAYSSPRRGGAGFVDPRPLTAWVRVVLYIEAALLAVLLAGNLFNGDALFMRGGLLDLTGKETTTQVIGAVLMTLVLLMVIVRGVLCLRWMWRANKNAHSLASMIETSPGWAWGAFFIPIWNLYKPFQTMSEIWRSAENPTSWRGLSTPGILWLWWALWLGLSLFSRLPDALAGNRWAAVVAMVLHMAAWAGLDLLFAYMIDHVAKRQVEAHEDTVFD